MKLSKLYVYRGAREGLAILSMSAGLLSSTLQADDWGPIEVHTDFADLAISHQSNVLHRQATLTLVNDSDTEVNCQVTFRNGPELPVERKGRISPGDSRLFTASLQREVVGLAIDAQCSASER